MLNVSTSARIARFGRGAVVLRGRNEALDEGTLRSGAPTLFADAKHSSRSERYSHIPTFEVLRGLEREGFRPYEVRVGGSGDLDKRNHTKHLIRLRHDGVVARVGGAVPEVLLLNSHDGTSAYKLMYGLFRMVCSNGLVTADELTELRIPHKGDVVSKVIEGTYQVLGESRRVVDQVQRFVGVTLSRPEQLAFAESAAMLRWAPDADTGTSNVPVRPDQVVYPRRSEDAGADLWSTFNVTQENLVNGGLHYSQRNARGTLVHRTARPVNGIDGNVTLNRALWALAAKMAELKA
jgi:hypothetical protein